MNKYIFILFLFVAGCDVTDYLPHKTITNIVYVQIEPKTNIVYPSTFSSNDTVAFENDSESMEPGVNSVAINPYIWELGMCSTGVALFVGQPYKVVPRYKAERMDKQFITNSGGVSVYRYHEYAYFKVDHVRVHRIRYGTE